MLRRQAVALSAALGAAALGVGLSRGRAETLKQFRVGILGGENTQDRLARYDGFQKVLQAHLQMPVTLFPAADYAGVMQGIAAGQLEAAEFGAS
ncbi:MAG TPA: PhnD/SsuA/transferrin family substrate-binding protein, partial [Rhodopila sp.]